MFGNASRTWLDVTRTLMVLLATAACSASSDSGSARPGSTGTGTGALGAGGSRAVGAPGVGSGVGPGFGNSSSPTSTGAGTAPGSAMMECASALVHTSRSTPTIEFVIDGSGSMCAPFGGSTRWQALRTALLDPMKGLIIRLEKSVVFGAVLYDGTIDLTLALTAVGGGGMGMMAGGQNPMCSLMYVQNKDMGACPQLIDVPPAKMNAMAIAAKYPMTELGGSTPTDKAMDVVMNNLIMGRMAQAPDQKAQSPVYVILATDGAPNDICVNGAGGDGTAQQNGVIAAVTKGAMAGIKTWVISLAGNDAALQAHLDNVARAGDPMNAMAHTFNPMNPDDLVKTLATLLGGAVGCNVALNGMVKVGQECLGKVELNGNKLPCCQQDAGGAWTCDKMPSAAPNGWHLTDPGSIELLGDTCSNFLISTDDMLHASFPCAIFTPS